MAGPQDLHNIKAKEKLTQEELIRACRLAVQAELDASNFYEIIAEQSDSRIVKEVFQEVSNEEKVHAGEFLKLISLLDPEEANHYAKGAQEVSQHVGSQGAGPGMQRQEPTATQMQGNADIPGYTVDRGTFEDKKNKRLQDLNEEIDEALEQELKN